MHLARLATFAAALLLGAASAACSEDDPDAEPTPTPATATAELDSMVAMGHSAVTGFGSEGDQDSPANSWITGDNPQVVSIYQRLLADYPGLEGHNYNVGSNGAPAEDLLRQAESLAQLDPLPDVAIVQILGNDIRCDGSDADNFAPVGATIDQMLTTVEGINPATKVVFVHHWSSIEQYAAALAQIDGAQSPFGFGRCGILTKDGETNPKGIAYLQSVFDGYFDAIAAACAQHPRCTTDSGGIQTTPIAPEDLSADLIHLTLSGQAKEAATAWDLLNPSLTA